MSRKEKRPDQGLFRETSFIKVVGTPLNFFDPTERRRSVWCSLYQITFPSARKIRARAKNFFSATPQTLLFHDTAHERRRLF
jgi:hypothetical protein